MLTPRCSLRRSLRSPVAGGEGPTRVLRLRFCRWHGCGRVFVICEACDHGQAFCSSSCRDQARRATLEAAGRRYQRSERGRAQHRERQRAYRERRPARVTHHPGDLHGHEVRSRRALPSPRPESAAARTPTSALQQCNICGIQSSWFNPFAEPGARSKTLSSWWPATGLAEPLGTTPQATVGRLGCLYGLARRVSEAPGGALHPAISS